MSPHAEIRDLLRRRAATGSQPPHRDGASIALAVEGGAMRGVVSAGMGSALEALGYGAAFDAVYGASAGAINAAYFLAGQANFGAAIYYEDINNRSFIDLARALRGRAIVNLAFLLDDVAVRRKPLDVARVLASRTRLRVLATDVMRAEPVVFGDFADAVALFGALRAGATMPVVAGDPCTYASRLLLDAALSEPIPVAAAEHDGHTHVVALLTRGADVRPRVSAFDRYYVAPRLRRISPTLADRYLSRAEPYAALVRTIEAGRGPLGRAQVLGVRTDARVGKLERRSGVLESGARQGYDAIMRMFAS